MRALLCLGLLLCSAALAQGILPDPPTDGRRRMPPVWLVEHRVKVTIENHVARTEVEQVFENLSAVPVEGTYLFPLPAGAAVSAFRMTMGDREVAGEILDADKARSIYVGIVRQRLDPGLLEYAGQGCYRARVFPIPPRGRATVKLAYSQMLSLEAGALEYRYPLRSDKFAPGPVKVSGVIEAREESGLATFYSPSHKLDIVRKGDEGLVASFEEAQSPGDRDFRLLYTLGKKSYGLSLASHRPPAEDGYFLMLLSPNPSAPGETPLPKDIVFVLDTSGSMGDRGGAKMKQAKAAVDYALGRLDPRDRFNLVPFATEARPFRPTVVEATPENVAAARALLASLEATGGTAIEDALTTALRLDRTEGRVPLVVFLTDGQPTIGRTQPLDILDGVTKANRAEARLFVFGVGDDVNALLLTELADRTRGTGHFVAESEDIERKVSSLYDKIAAPVLTDVKVRIDDVGEYDVYPRTIGDLFRDQQIAIVGRYKGAGPRAVRLSGRYGGKELEFIYEGTFTDKPGRDFLPRLWAVRKIGFLLSEIRRNGERKELVDEVRNLGLRHGIVTPYTSFLVVEEQELRRLGPVFAGGDSGVSPPSGPSPDLSGVREEAEAARDALKERKSAGGGAVAGAKLAGRYADAEGGGGHAGIGVKVIDGKTFRLKDGVWTDRETEQPYDGPSRRIVYLSDEYLKLLENDAIARLLSVGPQVIFVFGGTWYEIVVE